MQEQENASGGEVVSIDKSPLTIGQKNYLKKVFNAHKSEVEKDVSTHRQEISKIFESYSKKVAESVGAHNAETVKQMNEALAKVDKKFSGLYSTLINKFLVKQEEKVFLCELGVQALLEVFGERLLAKDTEMEILYEEISRIKTALKTANIEVNADPFTPKVDEEKFNDELQKQVESRIESLAEAMKKEAEEKAAQAQAPQQEGTDAKVAEQPAQPAAEAPAQNGE